MIPRDVEFPEYGSGGDYAGARRSRRAFRYGVAASILFTLGLWFAEQYLRYDETERHYLLALTSEPGPARVHLRQAIKIDADTEERPTSKYLVALAEREEEERRLQAFEAAYQADPRNSFLAMRYACELFKRGQARRAHELFGLAHQYAPQNALPLYLEAAVLPFVEADNQHLEEAFQIIERANAGGDPLIFQRPLWFSTLPEGGAWHTQLTRQTSRELLEPMQKFTDAVLAQARAELPGADLENWRARLATLQELGSRIVLDSEPEVGTPHAVVGFRIQLEVIGLLETLAESPGPDRTELAALKKKLEHALGLVVAFEVQRQEVIAGEKIKFQLPIELVWQTAFLLGAVYLVAYAAARLLRARRQSWTLRHGVWAKVALLTANVLLFLLLLGLTWLQTRVGVGQMAVIVLPYLWYGVVGVAALFGAFYPAFMLPLPHLVVRQRVGEGDQQRRLLTLGKRSRRIAYISLMRRYYGILLGCYAITICVWIIVFRVFNLLYPWQIKLLIPGLIVQEIDAVRGALSILS